MAVEASDLVKLILRSVNIFEKKNEQKTFRLACPFNDHVKSIDVVGTA